MSNHKQQCHGLFRGSWANRKSHWQPLDGAGLYPVDGGVFNPIAYFASARQSLADVTPSHNYRLNDEAISLMSQCQSFPSILMRSLCNDRVRAKRGDKRRRGRGRW